jgi:hypothetical protein
VHLRSRDAEVLGQPRARGIHPFPGFARSRKVVVRLDLEPAVILTEAAHDRAAGIGAAGVLEERLSLERTLRECRELPAHKAEVEFLH